jgi:CRISPR/Cas system CMR-associated protein Cmr5 small subunit
MHNNWQNLNIYDLKNSQNSRNKGELPQFYTEYLQKIPNIILNNETLNAVPLRLEKVKAIHSHHFYSAST